MRDDEAVIAQSNEVFVVERRGFDHIPEAERNMTLPQVAWFWVANSLNLFSFALGALRWWWSGWAYMRAYGSATAICAAADSTSAGWWYYLCRHRSAPG